MSLKQYAGKKKKERTSTITARIPDSVLEHFREYCSELDITINEAINYLIKNELENGQETNSPAPKPQQKKTEAPKSKAKTEPPAPKRYPADEFYGTPEPDYSKTLDELLNEEPDPTDERYYYVLRKTFACELYEDEDKWYDNGVLHWLVPKDCQAHYDRSGNLIPFRYTMPDSYTIKQPTAAEIKEIEKAYGKPVKIEE